MVNKISIIVATAKNNVIGYKNTIPWKSKEDMKHFKKTTTGHVVVMGRNTWESLGSKPLKDRINIILSSKVGGEVVKINHEDDITSEIHVGTLDEALRQGNFYFDKEIFIIGGQSLYEQVLELNLVSKVILTKLDIEVEGDTYFPTLGEEWEELSFTKRFDTDPKFSISIFTKEITL